MSKVIITRKEIDKLKSVYTRLKGILDKYKEEEYKEVFISDNQVFIYDIYLKDWSMHFFNGFSLEKGFYNYSILEQVIPLFKELDKDKIYKYKMLIQDIFLVYNKELMAWEDIYVYSKKIRKTMTQSYRNSDLHEPITKEEFNKLILIYELLT